MKMSECYRAKCPYMAEGRDAQGLTTYFCGLSWHVSGKCALTNVIENISPVEKRDAESDREATIQAYLHEIVRSYALGQSDTRTMSRLYRAIQSHGWDGDDFDRQIRAVTRACTIQYDGKSSIPLAYFEKVAELRTETGSIKLYAEKWEDDLITFSVQKFDRSGTLTATYFHGLLEDAEKHMVDILKNEIRRFEK